MPQPFLSLAHNAGTEQALVWFWQGTADELALKVGCGLADQRGDGIPGKTVPQQCSDGGEVRGGSPEGAWLSV